MERTEVRPQSLHVTVFNELEKNILNGTYPPGQQLTEIKICHDLGVSRTPVREALRQLENEGLVRAVPNKGATVIGITDKDITDIYAIRMSLEALAAKWAAENISPSQLKDLTDTVDLQEFYLSKNDTERIWQLDRTFHEILYESSASHPLQAVLSQFHNYLRKPREMSIRSEGRAKLAVSEHRDIVNAITSKDPEKAEILAREHVSHALENILRCKK